MYACGPITQYSIIFLFMVLYLVLKNFLWLDLSLCKFKFKTPLSCLSYYGVIEYYHVTLLWVKIIPVYWFLLYQLAWILITLLILCIVCIMRVSGLIYFSCFSQSSMDWYHPPIWSNIHPPTCLIHIKYHHEHFILYIAPVDSYPEWRTFMSDTWVFISGVI